MLRTFLQSSQDNTQIANKIKGGILVFSSLIILTASQLFHVTLTANDVITLATEVSTLIGMIWMIFGSLLHLVTFLGTKKLQPGVDPIVE